MTKQLVHCWSIVFRFSKYSYSSWSSRVESCAFDWFSRDTVDELWRAHWLSVLSAHWFHLACRVVQRFADDLRLLAWFPRRITVEIDWSRTFPYLNTIGEITEYTLILLDFIHRWTRVWNNIQFKSMDFIDRLGKQRDRSLCFYGQCVHLSGVLNELMPLGFEIS